jgi:cholesterol oxidase
MHCIVSRDQPKDDVTAATTATAPTTDRRRRTLRAPEPEIHPLTAADGVQLRLTRYRAGDRGPVILAHGLGVSSRIFSIDTISTNVLEYLCELGFDVWLLDYRVSIELPASSRAWTADDVATNDFPPAIAAVRAATGADRVDALVHCYGATTFFMSMLAGLENVRSIFCSQIATHVRVPWRIRTEAWSGFATLLRSAGLRALSARADENRGPAKRAYDAALRLFPLPAQERCDSETCRRISFLYGRLYEHAQLDAATHAALPELFGVSSMAAFEHLASIIRRGHLVTASGRDEYLPHIGRLALPITFIHGALNACYLPASTAATYDALSAAHGTALYERHVIPRYGHIDCVFGKNAATDVYPLMLRHFDRVGS